MNGLIKILYKYKDDIDYNSCIYFVTSTYHNNGYIEFTPCDRKIRGVEFKYESTSPKFEPCEDVKRFLDIDTELPSMSDMNEVDSSSYVPRAALLFDKHNTCRYMNLKPSELKYLYLARNESRQSIRNDAWFLNIGALVFKIDSEFHYKGTDLVPIEYLQFVSKDQPHPCNLNLNIPPDYTEFIKNNIDYIREDLSIPPLSYERREIKYIEKKFLLYAEKAKRKEKLLKALRELEVE